MGARRDAVLSMIAEIVLAGNTVKLGAVSRRKPVSFFASVAPGDGEMGGDVFFTSSLSLAASVWSVFQKWVQENRPDDWSETWSLRAGTPIFIVFPWSADIWEEEGKQSIFWSLSEALQLPLTEFAIWIDATDDKSFRVRAVPSPHGFIKHYVDPNLPAILRQAIRAEEIRDERARRMLAAGWMREE